VAVLWAGCPKHHHSVNLYLIFRCSFIFS